LVFACFRCLFCCPLLKHNDSGWYGAETSTTIFDESAAAASDFAGRVGSAWEAAARQFEALGVRHAQLRLGVVMARDGGAYVELSRPIRWSLAAALGSGAQWLPWIHVDDATAAFSAAIDDRTLCGALNVVAPSHVTNQQATAIIADVLGRPYFLPNVPEFVVHAMLGEMAALVLQGSRVQNNRKLPCKYKDFKQAIEDLEKQQQ
jgi:uncharacterized protein (TIGR01777 family)